MSRITKPAGVLIALGVALAACSSGDPRATQTTGGTAATAGDRGCGLQRVELTQGDPIPDSCLFETFEDARMVSIGEFRAGRPLVLNFWASWCTFCIKEMPDFQRVHDDVGDRVPFLGLDLLGVQGETRGAATTLAARTGVSYPLGYDADGALYLRLSPRVLMPTTVFVRADGTIALRQFGPLTEQQLRGLIDEHLT